MGKRIGLSFLEMNDLRVRDLFDLVRSYVGEKDDDSKVAAQADIDVFYGR